jgi:hypothetical protein
MTVHWKPAIWEDYECYRGIIRECLNVLMQQLYAALGIPEYWVVNVLGQQVLAFRLVDGKYQECDTSVALPRLPIALLEETLDRLAGGRILVQRIGLCRRFVSCNP